MLGGVLFVGLGIFIIVLATAGRLGNVLSAITGNTSGTSGTQGGVSGSAALAGPSPSATYQGSDGTIYDTSGNVTSPYEDESGAGADPPLYFGASLYGVDPAALPQGSGSVVNDATAGQVYSDDGVIYPQATQVPRAVPSYG